MLSKAVTDFNNRIVMTQVSGKSMTHLQYRRFAGSSKPFILNRIFNSVDTSTTGYRTAKYDPAVMLAVSDSTSNVCRVTSRFSRTKM